MQKIIIYILSFLLTASLVCNVVLQHRLEQNRQQLEYVRMELERHENNYKSITDSVRRTAEILNESVDSVRELRKQISEVRKVFEDMEDYISGFDSGTE